MDGPPLHGLVFVVRAGSENNLGGWGKSGDLQRSENLCHIGGCRYGKQAG